MCVSIIKVLCFEPFLVHSPAAACGGCCPSCHTKGGRLLPSQSLCAHLIVQFASNESREVAIPIRSSTNVWRPPGCRSPQSRSLVQEKAGEIAFTRANSFTHPFIRLSGEGSTCAARPDSIQKQSLPPTGLSCRCYDDQCAGCSRASCSVAHCHYCLPVRPMSVWIRSAPPPILFCLVHI